jgi:hypothetical protein
MLKHIFFKVTTCVEVANTLQKGGVQKEDLKYDPQTRTSPPTQDPSPEALQHIGQQYPHQYGENRTYYMNHPHSSPFITNQLSACQQQYPYSPYPVSGSNSLTI